MKRVIALALFVLLLVGVACASPEVPTATPYPTYTLSPTQTPYPTHTPYPTLESLPTYVPAPTYTPLPTAVPYPTYTPLPLATPYPTYTLVPTFTPYPIPTTYATNTPYPPNTPYPTYTPYPTHTPIPTPTPTPTLAPTPTPTIPSTPAELVQRVKDAVVRVEAGYSSRGSGFIFDVEETTAFVATNHHVVEDADSVDVVARNSKTYKAIVLGWDSSRDVAVLAICCATDFAAIPWEEATPPVGTQVVAIGYPRSSESGVTATIGEVTEPDFISRRNDFIPHSAPLNPGNSGGPLFSMTDAKVLGINTARGTQTLSFYAVPFQAIEKQMAEWRSQLVVIPAPTPTPLPKAYRTIRVGDSYYTVNEVRDPVPSRYDAEEGKRLVAIDVTQKAAGNDVSYNPWYFSVQDSDGYLYDLGGYADVDPRFSSGNLNIGQIVRGWVSFEIPEAATLVAVLVESGIFGPNVVIADLTE